MSVLFPPGPDHPDEVAMVAETFATVVEGRVARYVSSPLTTGELFIGWRGSNSAPDPGDVAYAEAFRRAVIEPNRDNARTFVARLRADCTDVVIDPTSLPNLPGWTQEDYRSLWGEVIRRYVRLVVFRNGWEFSDGCTYEFFVAAGQGVLMTHEDISPIGEEEGIRLIRAAIDWKRANGVSAEFALAVLAAMRPGNAERRARL
jgi:hypothetical protein